MVEEADQIGKDGCVGMLDVAWVRSWMGTRLQVAVAVL